MSLLQMAGLVWEVLEGQFLNQVYEMVGVQLPFQ